MGARRRGAYRRKSLVIALLIALAMRTGRGVYYTNTLPYLSTIPYLITPPYYPHNSGPIQWARGDVGLSPPAPRAPVGSFLAIT